MPAGERESMRALSDAQIQQFIQDGFVRIDRAFPASLPSRPAPSYGGTPDAIPMIQRRGRNRSFGSAATVKSRS